MLMLVTGTEINGRYVIHEPIGTGGSASVWKASDKELNRDVALKRLLKPASVSEQELSLQLKKEAQRNAQLIHTNIVQLYDFIESNGEHLIVMEYVDGRPLSELLRGKALRNELLPLDVSVSLLRDILTGMSFAHNKGICHRDLSPTNILLTAQGAPKIADFGIAIETDSSTTEETQAGTGNPNYMSPEQARGEAADISSDLFMIGIIGYLLLTGRHPFSHPSGLFCIKELLMQVEYNPDTPATPPSLTTSQQRLFREYASVVMRLLQRERAQRFDSARAAIDALDSVEPFAECAGCGERMPEHNKFCGNCGSKFTVASPPLSSVSLNIQPPQSADELCNSGFLFSQQRLWPQAVQKYQEALAVDPRHARTLWNIGFALNRLGRHDDADRYLTTGLQLNFVQYRAAMLYERAYARTNRKDYEHALNDINNAIDLQSPSAKFLFLKARIHQYRGEKEFSTRYAEEVLRLEPGHSGALRILGPLQ